MLEQLLYVLPAAAVFVGVVWVLRRIIPKVSCPACGSSRWMLMGEGGMKQCLDCSKIFYI
jgi:hypothetical protein